MEPVAVFVEILVLALLHVSAFHLVGGLEPERGLHAVVQAAHVDLSDRCALAGMDIFCAQDRVKLIVDFDDIAFTQRTGDDFHGSSNSGGLEARWSAPIPEARAATY